MLPQGAASAELVGRSSSTSGVNTASAAKHADDIRRKVDEFGLIHKCASCGYAMRAKAGAAAPAADASKAPPPAATGTDQGGHAHA